MQHLLRCVCQHCTMSFCGLRAPRVPKSLSPVHASAWLVERVGPSFSRYEFVMYGADVTHNYLTPNGFPRGLDQKYFESQLGADEFNVQGSVV